MPHAAAPAHFSPEQRRFYDDACAQVSAAALRRIVTDAVNIASPSGKEAPLARYFSAQFAAEGIDATTQSLGAESANAIARARGTGGGPSLLIYAPIDMHIDGDGRDADWIDLDGRDDLKPLASSNGDYVIGLGAENPKGHAACVAAALIALARADVPLCGDVIAGFGASGMPVDGAHGRGCAALLERDDVPEYAVIAKPGGAVAYEEVGIAWFAITVHGSYGYAGVPLRDDARNAIVDAATAIALLQAWFPDYTARNTSGLVAPNGSITAIHGGRAEKAAFLPNRCTFYVDLRLSPRTAPDDAAAQLDAALETIRITVPGIRIESKCIVAIPGTSTPADNWIVTSSIRAWEATYGRPHAFRTGTSGATDANIIRAHGVPTARIGMPPLGADAPFAGRFSMGVTSVNAMVQLTTALIAIAIDTCTRKDHPPA